MRPPTAYNCSMASERFFNTEGPIVPERHYHVPPLSRLDLDAIRTLIDRARYFVLHAPRQTGKTSTLEALKSLLNAGDSYRCVYVNVEVGQSAREDVAAVMQAILNELAYEAQSEWDDDQLGAIWPETLERAGPHAGLRESLARWAQASPRPLVLLIDEIDALIGDALLAVLRQLRAGYRRRPNRFPQSVVLCGVRDIRDYRIRSTAQNALIDGGSAFNVSAGALRLGDFTREEVDALLGQHSAETAQSWCDEARDRLWNATAGQAWLVNAIAANACAAVPSREPITEEAVREATEQLILSRTVHLDQLSHKLQEDRVRRVIEPLLTGGVLESSVPTDDLDYVRDLGLISRGDPIRVANPIYREVIPRDLTYLTQSALTQEAADYVGDHGELNVRWLLRSFQAFFREHSEHWIERFRYREAGPQLLLQAFLQRIVNGGGRVEREYGLGRMRTDLLIVWPGLAGQREVRKVVIECKLLHRSLDTTVREGFAQTLAYMDRAGATEGHLVVFDRTEGRTWEEKVFHRTEVRQAASIDVWGM